MSILGKIVLSLLFVMGVLKATPHEIDKSHTHVGFSVKHLMITNVKGEFKAFDGKMDFDYKTKKFKALSANIKTNSIYTGIEKRDNHLKSEDFFLVTKYPNMTFVMKSYIKEDDDEGKMIGDLTIRGITKRVIFDVEIGGTVKDFSGNNRVGFTLEGKINRMDYGLKWNQVLEFGGVAVDEEVKIIIEVQAVEI